MASDQASPVRPLGLASSRPSIRRAPCSALTAGFVSLNTNLKTVGTYSDTTGSYQSRPCILHLANNRAGTLDVAVALHPQYPATAYGHLMNFRQTVDGTAHLKKSLLLPLSIQQGDDGFVPAFPGTDAFEDDSSIIFVTLVPLPRT